MKTTLRHKSFVALLISIVSIASGCGSAKQQVTQKTQDTDVQLETVDIKAAGWRTTDAPFSLQNLSDATQRLNQELANEKSKYRVKVTTITKPTSDELNQFIIFSSKSGNAPDIVNVSYNNIGWMADGGYIRQLDGIEKANVFKNLMPGYWNPVTWDKHIWGVIQDTEARPVYYNKDVLKKMGWSDQQISDLPKKVQNGEFTLADLDKMAQQAVDQKLTKYGFLHSSGQKDLAMLLFNNGVQVYDDNTKQYVLDKQHVLETFQSIKQMVDQKVLPSSMMSISTNDRLKSMVNGQSLFMEGGVWEEAKWQQNNWNTEMGKVSEQWIMDHLGVMLLPPSKQGAKPVTVSGPYAYVVSKQTQHPDLVQRLLEDVSAPDFQKAHSVQSSHIPFTKEGQELVKDNVWLSTVSYMTEYSKFVPNDVNEPKFEKILTDAFTNLETGEMTPEQDVQWMEQQMKLDLGNITVK